MMTVLNKKKSATPCGIFAAVVLLLCSAFLVDVEGYKVIGSYGKLCATSCTQREGTLYTWCHIEGTTAGKYSEPSAPSWDYCSPYTHYDYLGKKCINYCDNYGYKYRWCNVEGGSWGYCSY